MSKAARIVSQIAGVVATVAAVAAILFPPLAPIFMTISMIASAVSAVAMAVSQATMKPPDMKGSVGQVVLGMNLPVPYCMGRTYMGGVLVYDKSAPPADRKNRTNIHVITAGGPIDSFEKIYADYSPITFATESGGLISGVASGFYGADGGYMWANTRKGLKPDTALTPAAGRPAFSEWGTDYKLSGLAAYSLTMEFDEDGERFASGVPQFGVIGKMVKAYDPRLDSTYPGGSGAHRWADEDTWTWTENPALHALTYCRGRFAPNGFKTVGCGLPYEYLRIEEFVDFANQCDANGWTLGGSIWDGAGQNRWDNIKRICAAGAGRPVWSGGKLGVHFSAPKVPVFTITADDLADGEASVKGMQGFRDKINTVVPRVRLETHKWEYVPLAGIAGETYLLEDGEEKTREIQYDLVQDMDQGSQLAALEIANSREFGPIQLPLKPRFLLYRPGEAGIVDIPEMGLFEQLAIIESRTIDWATGTVSMTLMSETTEKHAWALTHTGEAPPTPTLIPPEEIDEVVSGGTNPPIITLTPSANGFTFIDFVPADANAIITIDAIQNRTGTLVWSASPAVTLTTVDADTRTLSLANFGDNQFVTITATNEFGAVASVVIGRIDITTPMDSIIPDGHFIGGISDGTVTEPPFISNTFGQHIP